MNAKGKGAEKLKKWVPVKEMVKCYVTSLLNLSYWPEVIRWQLQQDLESFFLFFYKFVAQAGPDLRPITYSNKEILFSN